MLEQFLIMTLSAAGCTNIVVRSILFKPLRSWILRHWPINGDRITLGYFVHCPTCFGFWLGLLFGLGHLLFSVTWLAVFLWLCTGFSASITATLADRYLMQQTMR